MAGFTSFSMGVDTDVDSEQPESTTKTAQVMAFFNIVMIFSFIC
ncbi:hypothetical protein [Pseudoalteromonas prydzensis]|nr:hypothetical protein [Pseudoalteromonas prydzensis]